MANYPTWIAVVAGALCNADGQFLLQRRPPEKQHGGLWEFPGGKVEHGESPLAALIRELNEELTIAADPRSARPLAFAESAPAEGRPGIVILLYEVGVWQGTPIAELGAEIGWFGLDSIRELPLPPLDSDLLASICGREQ